MRTCFDADKASAGVFFSAVGLRSSGGCSREQTATSEQLKVEFAAVRAETEAEISHAAQQEVVARWERR